MLVACLLMYDVWLNVVLVASYEEVIFIILQILPYMLCFMHLSSD